MSWNAFTQNILLCKDVCDLLRSQKKTLANAESCTGGLLSALITEIPGSSQVFLGGITCYSNLSKIKLLSVDAALIEKVGAVSEDVAVALASKVRTVFEADFGIGITGIAGPDGGSPAKPVGTVWWAISDGKQTRKDVLHLSGTRREIRFAAVEHVLNEFYNFVKG